MSRAATVSRAQRGRSGAELFSRENLSTYVCERVRGPWEVREKEACVRVSHQPLSQCVDVTLMQIACTGIHLLLKNPPGSAASSSPASDDQALSLTPPPSEAPEGNRVAPTPSNIPHLFTLRFICSGQKMGGNTE